MTTFTTPRTWSTSELVTAVMLNEQIRDNMLAIFVGAAGGDIDYYSAANAKARLAKPATAANYLLMNTSAGVPSWILANGSTGALHARTQLAWNSAGQVITATSYTNITNATVNIVTTVTCTILMLAHGVMAVQTGGGKGLIQPVIGANAGGDTVACYTSNPYYVPFSIHWHKTGVAAGTIACKLQGKANSAASGDHLLLDNGYLEILAFAE